MMDEAYTHSRFAIVAKQGVRLKYSKQLAEDLEARH